MKKILKVDVHESPQSVVIEKPFTPRQLTEFLEISLSTLKRELKDPAFPRFHVGQRVRFLPGDVVRYLKGKSK